LRKKSLLQKLLFKWLNMEWHGHDYGYIGGGRIFKMELCTPIWLNHDYGDGGVVDISVVDAYSRVEVCTRQYFWVRLANNFFLGSKSFSKKTQNSNGHIS
jgi:hypothetical protein